MNLFGRRPSAPAQLAAPAKENDKVSVVSSLSKMQTILDDLERREEHLQKRSNTALQEAKAKNAKGDKKGALMQLKRKKMFEKEIEKIANSRMTLETQMHAIESANVTTDVVRSMQMGATVQKELTSKISIEKVEALQDDIVEHTQLAEEIARTLGTSVSGDVVDDDELIAELEEEMAAERAGEVGQEEEEETTVVKTTTTTTARTVVVNDKSSLDAELADLERSLRPAPTNKPVPPVPTGKVAVPASKRKVTKEEQEEEEELRRLERELAA